jgi:hypothetical protein
MARGVAQVAELESPPSKHSLDSSPLLEYYNIIL